MTKESTPGCTLLSVFYRRPRLMQSLSWIGSFGILSSGIVVAQTDGIPDNLGGSRTQHATSGAKSDREPAFARHGASAEGASTTSFVRSRFTPSEGNQAADLQPKRQRLRAPVLALPDTSETGSRSSINFSSNNLKAPRERLIARTYENNNSYIDSTNYNVGATARSNSRNRNYEPPSSVVFSERLTGCRQLGNCGTRTRSENDYTASRYRLGRQQDIASRQQRLVGNIESRIIKRWQNDGDSDSASPWRGSIADSAPSRTSTLIDSGFVNRSRPPVGDSVVLASQPRTTDYVGDSSFASRRRSLLTDRVALATEQPRNNVFSNLGLLASRKRTIASSSNEVNIGPLRVSNSGVGISRRSYDDERENKSGNSSSSPSLFNPNIPLPLLPPDGDLSFIFPLSIPAQITSIFGWRVHPITGDRRFHSGTDLGAPMGTPVLAAYAGQVALANWMGGYGLAVVLQHNQKQQTLYGHLSEVFVQPGQWVDQGTVIGKVGTTGNSTGPHLHFEWRQMTAEGWVATDPGAQLQYAMAQMMRALQTAQAPSQPGT